MISSESVAGQSSPKLEIEPENQPEESEPQLLHGRIFVVDETITSSGQANIFIGKLSDTS